LEGGEEAVFQAVEGAVGHEEGDVAGVGVGEHPREDLIVGAARLRGWAAGGDRAGQGFGRETLARRNWIVFLEIDRAEINSRGAIERRSERVLENIAARGIRSRLEGGEYSAAWEPLRNCFEGYADRGRMVREIIDDSYSIRFADHLLAADDAGERFEAS